MMDIDSMLLEFVRTNLITLGLVGSILTVVAKRLDWQWLIDIIEAVKDRVRGSNVRNGSDRSGD